MIEITSGEARLLARAMRTESASLVQLSESLPLRSQDPLTRRYEYRDKAYAFRQRARDLIRVAQEEDLAMAEDEGIR